MRPEDFEGEGGEVTLGGKLRHPQRLILDLNARVNGALDPANWAEGKRYVMPWIPKGLAKRLWRIAQRSRQQIRKEALSTKSNH